VSDAEERRGLEDELVAAHYFAAVFANATVAKEELLKEQAGKLHVQEVSSYDKSTNLGESVQGCLMSKGTQSKSSGLPAQSAARPVVVPFCICTFEVNPEDLATSWSNGMCTRGGGGVEGLKLILNCSLLMLPRAMTFRCLFILLIPRSYKRKGEV